MNTRSYACVAVANMDSAEEEAFRSNFPLSFGKQEKRYGARDTVHASTRRREAVAPRNASRDEARTAVAPGIVGPPVPPAALVGPAKPARPSSGQAQDSSAGSAPFVGPPRPAAIQSQAEPPIGPPRPPALSAIVQGRQDGGSIGPPAPSRAAERQEAARSALSSDAGPLLDTPQEPVSRLPRTNEFALKGHTKLVSALDVDRSGARVVTGGLDYRVCIYDFNGMKSDGRPFRELMPFEGQPVHALSYSPSGDAFLCVTGEHRVKIYDRDGHERGESKRGDMYLVDMKNTKGHVAGCTNGQWHPTDRHVAASSSVDGTVRIWDCESLAQRVVVKCSPAGTGRAPVTALRYSDDGSMLATASEAGALQVWPITGNFGRSAALDVVPVAKAQQPLFGKQDWRYASSPKATQRSAHAKGCAITDVVWLRDCVTLLSRAADDTMRLWDVRRFQKPVHSWDLALPHTHARMCLSPQQDMVLTGVSQDADGCVIAAHSLKAPFELIEHIGLSGPVTALKWHPLLNQIVAGTGARGEGRVDVLYNPDMSEKGAMLCAGRRPRPKDPLDYTPPVIIHLPGALPMFRDDSWRKRKHEPEGGPRKAQVPDPGPTVAGPGGGGKIGATNNTLLTQYLLEKGGMQRLEEQMDPREAILRHKGADADFAAWTKAYAKTQPDKLLQTPEEDDE